LTTTIDSSYSATLVLNKAFSFPLKLVASFLWVSIAAFSLVNLEFSSVNSSFYYLKSSKVSLIPEISASVLAMAEVNLATSALC